MFFVQGYHAPLIALLVGSLGLYLSTVFLSMLPVVLAFGAGIAGLGAVAYFLLSSN